VQISVEGWRSSATDWNAVCDIPKEDLQPLTPGQAAVAKKMKISAEDYARSALAGKRSVDDLLAKTQRFAQLVEERLVSRNPGIRIDEVALETWEHKFRVSIQGKVKAVFRVDEAIVDDLFEGGSREADEKISRIVGLVLRERVA
jgi:hypothetical protein